jgi:hypothetical protein
MTNWIQWEIDDNDGDNPFNVPGTFEFNISFDYDPGAPTVLYSADGSGEPGYPPSATINGAECISLQLDGLHDKPQPPTQQENVVLADWFMTLVDHDSKLKRQIEACGLDQMYCEPDYDDGYD